MKKILGLLMLLGLFTFTACGKKGGESTESATEGTTTEQPADHSMDAGQGASMPADTTTQMAPSGNTTPPAEGADKKAAH
jgi:predicted small lipoprotein YifL